MSEDPKTPSEQIKSNPLFRTLLKRMDEKRLAELRSVQYELRDLIEAMKVANPGDAVKGDQAGEQIAHLLRVYGTGPTAFVTLWQGMAALQVLISLYQGEIDESNDELAQKIRAAKPVED